jgi:hypothetical protein
LVKEFAAEFQRSATPDGQLQNAALFGIELGSGIAPTGGRPILFGCGCSSGVEHNLAKVGVEGSNPFARSNSSGHVGDAAR